MKYAPVREGIRERDRGIETEEGSESNARVPEGRWRARMEGWTFWDRARGKRILEMHLEQARSTTSLTQLSRVGTGREVDGGDVEGNAERRGGTRGDAEKMKARGSECRSRMMGAEDNEKEKSRLKAEMGECSAAGAGS